MRLRRGLLAAVLTLLLTACGQTINGNITSFDGDTVNGTPVPGQMNPPAINNNSKTMQIREAWAQIGIPTQRQESGLNISDADLNGAVYMTIWNATGQSDRIVGAQTDVAEQALLVEATNDAGTKVWRKVDGIDLTKGGSGSAGAYITLFPSNYQILLAKVKQPIKPGDKINVTVQFEKAGPQQVEATVRDPLVDQSYTGQ